MTPLAERLRIARKKAGFTTASDAARAMGVNVVTYTAHENGGREYDRNSAAHYAETFGVDTGWLLYGASMPEDVSVSPLPADEDVGKFKSIEQFLHMLMQTGPEGRMVFEIKGDSMYDPDRPKLLGSFYPGDYFIIDREDRTPTPPGPFAIDDGTGISVRFIESINTDEPRLRISYRNPQYQPIEVSQMKVNIIGRVRGKITARL